MKSNVSIVATAMRKWGWHFKAINQHKIRFRNPRWVSDYTGTVISLDERGCVDLDPKRINKLKTHRVFFVSPTTKQMSWCALHDLKNHIKDPSNTKINSNRLPSFVRQAY